MFTLSLCLLAGRNVIPASCDLCADLRTENSDTFPLFLWTHSCNCCNHMELINMTFWIKGQCSTWQMCLFYLSFQISTFLFFISFSQLFLAIFTAKPRISAWHVVVPSNCQAVAPDLTPLLTRADRNVCLMLRYIYLGSGKLEMRIISQKTIIGTSSSDFPVQTNFKDLSPMNKDTPLF